MRTVQDKTKELILSVFIFVLIYTSHDTLIFGTNENPLFIKIGYGVLVVSVLALGIICLINMKRINKFAVVAGVCVISILIINTLCLKDFSGGIITKLCLMCVAVGLVNLFELKMFLKCFSKVMLFLSIISIIPFILNCVNMDIFKILPKIINLSGLEFHTGIFFNTIVCEKEYIRNYGIFREPSIFGIFITIALLYELTKKEKTHLWCVIVFIVTILTTFSTLAFISVGLAFFLFLLVGKNKFGKKIYFTVIPICISIAIIMVSVVANSFLEGEKLLSFQTRISSIIANLRVIFLHPVFGTGIDNYVLAIEQALIGLISDGGNTPGLLICYAMHGFFFGLICTFGFIGFAFEFSQNKFINFIVLGIFIVNMLMGSLIYNAIFYVIIIYGLESLLKNIYRTTKQEKK